MASWKKVIVSGSNISELNNDSNYLSTSGGGILSASAEGDAQGQIKLNGVNINANALGTGDSPQFVAVTANLTGNVTGTADTASYVAGGSVDGSVATATALETARNFSITGDVTASVVSFDGSGNVALSATLGYASVDTVQLVDGAVDGDKLALGSVGSGNFASSAKTAISGAFTSTSASIASDIASLEAATYDLNITADSGTPDTVTNAQTLTIAGTTNEIETSVSGQTITVGLPDDVTITGNLTVQGTRTELQVANLNVEDPLILLNSGSTGGSDVGIIFGGSDDTANAGHAIGWDDSAANFIFAEGVSAGDTSWEGGGGALLSKIGEIQTTSGANPSAASLQGVGAINVRTDDETIWIYS